jgi:dihydroflavonol-4-reductase
MTSKHQGEKIVENAVKQKGLQAIILNSASIMGPGDPNIHSPHNQIYNTIYKKMLFGAFPGGLAVVDVRDLVAIIIKALKRGKIGEKYLIVGANLTYQNIIKLIGKYAKHRVYPIRLPSFLSTAVGSVLEVISCFNKKRPLLTKTYGRLSGWYTYYSNEKSKKEFFHSYINFEKTIQDTCSYFEKNFL